MLSDTLTGNLAFLVGTIILYHFFSGINQGAFPGPLFLMKSDKVYHTVWGFSRRNFIFKKISHCNWLFVVMKYVLTHSNSDNSVHRS